MATWINQNREQRGWSIREFGRRIGVSHTHAARLANGDVEPDADMCIEIARAFGVSPESVMREAGILPPSARDQTTEAIMYLIDKMTPEQKELVYAQIRRIVDHANRQVREEEKERKTQGGE